MGITLEDHGTNSDGSTVHHDEADALNDMALHTDLGVALERGTIAREDVEEALEAARDAYEASSLDDAGVSQQAFYSSFVNLVYQESSYDADAESGHAFGYAQLTDHLAQTYMDKDADNLAPTENLSVGAQYLADLITGNDDIDIPQAGSLEKALVAYNGGYDALEYPANELDTTVHDLTIEEWLGFMETMRARHGADAPGTWRDQTYEYVQENIQASGNTREADSIQHAEAPAVAQTQAYLHMLGFQGASGTDLAVDGVMGQNLMYAIEQAELQHNLDNIYDDNADLNLAGDGGINAQLREVIQANETEIAERMADILDDAPSDADAAVEAVQITLNSVYDEDLKTDGIKGPKTVEAAQRHYDSALQTEMDRPGPETTDPARETSHNEASVRDRDNDHIDAPDAADDTGAIHEVEQGDTLSVIVQEYYDTDPDDPLSLAEIRNYAEKVADINGLANINQISVGQKLQLPPEEQLDEPGRSNQVAHHRGVEPQPEAALTM